MAQSEARLAAGVLALAGLLAAASAQGATVAVTGGAGLDGGEICLASGLCPTPSPSFELAPSLGLGTAGAATGSFVYDSSAQTVSFNLTLSAPVTFAATGGGSAIQLLTGSTFSGTVSVTQSAAGSGISVSETPGAYFGSETLNFSSGTTSTQNTPIISALTCTIGTGSDQCGVTLGPTLNQLSSGGTAYSAQYTFNTNVTPVPLPAALGLLLSGLGGIGAFARRRCA